MARADISWTGDSLDGLYSVRFLAAAVLLRDTEIIRNVHASHQWGLISHSLYWIVSLGLFAADIWPTLATKSPAKSDIEGKLLPGLEHLVPSFHDCSAFLHGMLQLCWTAWRLLKLSQLCESNGRTSSNRLRHLGSVQHDCLRNPVMHNLESIYHEQSGSSLKVSLRLHRLCRLWDWQTQLHDLGVPLRANLASLLSHEG